MRKLIMKCSDERRRAFAMITSVWEDDGTKTVEKTAVYEEGRKHLENMRRYREIPEKAYPGVGVCPAELTDGALVFDFMERQFAGGPLSSGGPGGGQGCPAPLYEKPCGAS